ncbi:pyridine nucleotide-disulfide oxidoreductase [Sedimentitalea sp. CY04]|uniref:Pyridine nucleotide-disulfide oxidoreductase n=1 Tax=Parasedimentitalea denitrificans TaxID=2211118 RepID=A0ABX0WF70_9RHOB|nr:FAD-dependent oxidoreductase [Sedimentitalea sp. CY04]NIZ63439.1 pyridine nucleotide-disulfide oxidoreductase [Sedimentitalea sp. CY04]
MSSFDIDVAIVGSGPSGIAAATALSQAGFKDIVVYEREADIGGIPRHTHHPSFGLRVFKRPMSGPKFIAALVRRCPDVRFETSTTITALRPGGVLELANATGLQTIRARHIILATGARETPRHGRLVPGLRPQGVITTGALQQFIYSAKLRPFERPVIVGTELVSFSALWTLRHAGIKPVAMIETGPRISAYRPATLLAKAMGVPIHYNTEITDISGIETLTQITTLTRGNKTAAIPCDGLIFSGCFTGENTIAAASHLCLNPSNRIPLVDQNWITSDSAVSVIGNATHPADMGDQCYLEGIKAGAYVAQLLAGNIAMDKAFAEIRHGDGIKMTTPSILRSDNFGDPLFDLSFHVTAPFKGTVCISHGEQVIYEEPRNCLPTRRITLRNIPFQAGHPIDLSLIGKSDVIA